jgi:hypothetical protein
MAAIASNLMFSGTSTSANATGSATGVSAESGAPGASATDASGTFMQLVTGMIEGNTTGEQLPSNLAAFLLTGDSGMLEGLETDTDTADLDDEEIGEDELLALSALLPGLQSFQPTKAAGGTLSHEGGLAGVTLGAAGRDSALQTTLDASQAALSSALEDAAAEALTSTDAAQSSSPNSGSHVQNLLAAHRAAEAAPQAASAEVRTPVGAPGWSDEIGTHLSMMAANGREAASLRLSPEHLGPLEIRISMKDGEASVVFNASNPDTRSALEQSLPRLREMFASQGLVLGDANVSRDAPRDSFRPATFADASRGSSDAGGESDVSPITSSRLGLVDTYV